MALSLLGHFDVQIQLTSDLPSGPSARDRTAPLELVEENRELLDDFLSRLQSIIRRPPASAPSSADDTRPTGRVARR